MRVLLLVVQVRTQCTKPHWEHSLCPVQRLSRELGAPGRVVRGAKGQTEVRNDEHCLECGGWGRFIGEKRNPGPDGALDESESPADGSPCTGWVLQLRYRTAVVDRTGTGTGREVLSGGGAETQTTVRAHPGGAEDWGGMWAALGDAEPVTTPSAGPFGNPQPQNNDSKPHAKHL
jgi:hypothetical protein